MKTRYMFLFFMSQSQSLFLVFVCFLVRSRFRRGCGRKESVLNSTGIVVVWMTWSSEDRHAGPYGHDA